MTDEEMRKETEDRIKISEKFSDNITGKIATAKSSQFYYSRIKDSLQLVVEQTLTEQYKKAASEIDSVFEHYCSSGSNQYASVITNIKETLISLFPKLKQDQIKALMEILKEIRTYVSPKIILHSKKLEEFENVIKLAMHDHIWMIEMLKRRFVQMAEAYSNDQLKVIHWQMLFHLLICVEN